MESIPPSSEIPPSSLLASELSTSLIFSTPSRAATRHQAPPTFIWHLRKSFFQHWAITTIDKIEANCTNHAYFIVCEFQDFSCQNMSSVKVVTKNITLRACFRNWRCLLFLCLVAYLCAPQSWRWFLPDTLWLRESFIYRGSQITKNRHAGCYRWNSCLISWSIVLQT